MTDDDTVALVYCECGEAIYPFGYHMPCDMEAYARVFRRANLVAMTYEESQAIQARANAVRARRATEAPTVTDDDGDPA